jgi:hypothetical protein
MSQVAPRVVIAKGSTIERILRKLQLTVNPGGRTWGRREERKEERERSKDRERRGEERRRVGR